MPPGQQVEFSAPPLAGAKREAKRALIARSPEKISECVGDIHDCLLESANRERMRRCLNQKASLLNAVLDVVSQMPNETIGGMMGG